MSRVSYKGKEYPITPNQDLLDMLETLAMDAKSDNVFATIDSVRELIWNYPDGLWGDLNEEDKIKYLSEFKVYYWTLRINRPNKFSTEDWVIGTFHKIIEEINKSLDDLGVNDESILNHEKIPKKEGFYEHKGICDSDKYHIKLLTDGGIGSVVIDLK